MDLPLPKLRLVEAFPVDIDGRQLICLRDPLQYATESLLLPYPAFFILALLDGTRSAIDLRAAWMRRFGSILESADILGLVATLDRHHYLESEGFIAHAAAVAAAFRRDPVRRPAHAGTSYPDEPDALRRHLSGFFSGVEPPALAGSLRGIVAPHIDLRVGGVAYGHAYAALAAATDVERFVVLGTSHHPGRALFSATRKDFATPLGTVTTDRAFLDRLAERTHEDLYADELLHRIEHTVEFQVVLLQHVLAARRPFTVVPILVSSFHEMVLARRTPARDGRVADFLAALRATLTDDPRPTVVIASVDLAHVGAKFGDAEGLGAELLALTGAKDRRLIAALERGDGDGFFDTVAADGDRTRICGLAPLYTFLALMDGATGHLLHYDRSHDTATRSSVTYASLAFTAV